MYIFIYAQCQKFNPLLPQMRQTHNKSVGGDSSPFPSGKHLFFCCATHRESRRLGARPGRVRCSASTLFTYQTDTVGQPRLFPSVTHVEEPRAQTRLDLVVTTSLVTQHTRLADFLCYFFFFFSYNLGKCLKNYVSFYLVYYYYFVCKQTFTALHTLAWSLYIRR